MSGTGLRLGWRGSRRGVISKRGVVGRRGVVGKRGLRRLNGRCILGAESESVAGGLRMIGGIRRRG